MSCFAHFHETKCNKVDKKCKIFCKYYSERRNHVIISNYLTLPEFIKMTTFNETQF